ncbi:galactose mutarotase [Sphingobacterium psychroaquaticum]|uniref:aldose epimerase family protein n=1 Tax=Sphingobacterium psychroaquaticum TaxID=561061 RepID=UPI00106CCBAA|nr:aldose epimerase family protein [Sphingobacterium psychroaquaticum]QBQ42512.1 galactose mutarotase [Sphingobacterium psychroaquaticum]
MAHYRLPDTKNFEHKIDGKNTHLIVLRNRSGMQVAFTDYGARIVSILVPNKSGDLTDVVLGFDSIQDYLKADEQYHGATIGRFANRIAHGKFRLDDQTFTLAQNNGTNSLHGGPGGFHTKVWDRQVSFKKRVDFYYCSRDGEEGFPGNLRVSICYELSEDNMIIIKYKAETDKKTVINLTNHAYFNLNGEGHSDILNHILTIPSEHYLPIDEQQIPFGFMSPVEGTAFDFRTGKRIADEISNGEEQLERGSGYDHTFVNTQNLSRCAATAFSATTGIHLDVHTTEPGIQLYTGNFLTGNDIGKSGGRYTARTGFCFETQHFPDSPNHPEFPSVVLEPGMIFESETQYRFSLKKESH